jgi:hypothetical protein
VVFLVTRVPGKKVATRLANHDCGGSALTAPGSLSHDVSWRNKKTIINVNPTSPAVHL